MTTQIAILVQTGLIFCIMAGVCLLTVSFHRLEKRLGLANTQIDTLEIKVVRLETVGFDRIAMGKEVTALEHEYKTQPEIPDVTIPRWATWEEYEKEKKEC